MAKIREDYLPPKNMWPEYLVPDEFADTPMELNLADYLLDRHIREGRGDNPAIKFMDKTITYAQLQQQVNKFGNSLKEAGVQAQDRVGIRLVNSPQAVVTIFAIEKIGAIPVPTSPLWSSEEVAFVANDSEMKFFVVNAPLMEQVEKAKAHLKHGTKVIVIGGNPDEVKAKGNLVYEEMLEKGSPELKPTMLKANDIGIMLYTSGTTGMPKGCVHFIRPAVIEAKIVNKYVYKMKPGDVLGGAAPVSFAAGFGTFTLLPFEGGAAISLIPKFTPPDMMDLIQKHKITVFTGLPTAYRALMKFPGFKNYDISSVRLYISGGDSLGAETLKGWQELTGKPIWEGLGGTETLHLVTSNTMNPEPVPDCIGKPLPGVEVRVIDEYGNDCRLNEIGSLIFKAPTGALYWKPYAHGERLLKSQRDDVVGGWTQMGDAGFMKEDGNICFVSRKDDMIKSSGYRISAAEVEEALKKHPAIAEAGVVGIPDPDKGQITKAFVILKEGHRASDEFFEELKDFLKEHIADYKLPRAIEYRESLPRTPTGKLLRRHLRPPQAEEAAAAEAGLPKTIYYRESRKRTMRGRPLRRQVRPRWAEETAAPEVRVPKRYFVTRIEGGPEVSAKPPKLKVGKRYDCIFGIKAEADESGIAIEIPPENLSRMRDGEVRVLAGGKNLEIRNSSVTLEIDQDCTSAEGAVNFNAVKPGRCSLQLLLLLDLNVVRTIEYDFVAVTDLGHIVEAPPVELECDWPTPEECQRLRKLELQIWIHGGPEELMLHFVWGAGSTEPLLLKEAVRRDLERKKQELLSYYANHMRYAATERLRPDAKDKFLKALKELGEEIFSTLFILPAQAGLQQTGEEMREFLRCTHPAPIQITPGQEHLPWMFLSDGEGPLGLRHGVEHILRGTLGLTPDLDLTRKPLRLVCGLAPVFESQKLEDGRSVLEPQKETLRKLRDDRFKVGLAEDEGQWLQELRDPADVIYLYCHGSSGQGNPCLWLTQRAKAISSHTIASSKDIDWSRNPLVILAACHSGEIDPFRAMGLANAFMGRKARGYIAAEGEVPTTFASLFMNNFFEEFFVKGGKPVGDVLVNLRKKFLDEMNNPWGILFTQFCRSEIMVRNY